MQPAAVRPLEGSPDGVSSNSRTGQLTLAGAGAVTQSAEGAALQSWGLM